MQKQLRDGTTHKLDKTTIATIERVLSFKWAVSTLPLMKCKNNWQKNCMEMHINYKSNNCLYILVKFKVLNLLTINGKFN